LGQGNTSTSGSDLERYRRPGLTVKMCVLLCSAPGPRRLWRLSRLCPRRLIPSSAFFPDTSAVPRWIDGWRSRKQGVLAGRGWPPRWSRETRWFNEGPSRCSGRPYEVPTADSV